MDADSTAGFHDHALGEQLDERAARDVRRSEAIAAAAVPDHVIVERVGDPEPLDVDWARARFAEYFDGVVARAGPAVGEA